MLVGRDRLPEESQCWIAIAAAQVAKNLVVGAVLFQNVNDVLNAAVYRRHGRSLVRGFHAAKVVIGSHLGWSEY